MKVILIAEDDDLIKLNPLPREEALPAAPAGDCEPAPERTLLLGWNRRAPMIVLELSRYVGPGSTLTIGADSPGIEQEVAGLVVAGDNLSVGLKRVDTSRRAEIEALDPTAFDHILVLGYGDHMPAQPADTRTLVTLLHLRGIFERSGKHGQRRQRDHRRPQPRAGRSHAGRRFRGQQQAGQPDARPGVGEPLSRGDFPGPARRGGIGNLPSAGADLYALGEALTFYDVVRAASARGEVAIGHHRVSQGDRRAVSGIVVNPVKSEEVRYGPGDRIIVLARN